MVKKMPVTICRTKTSIDKTPKKYKKLKFLGA